MLGQASPSKIKWLIREYNDKDLRNNKTSTKKYLKSIFFINIKRESTCEVFNRAPDRVGKQETRTIRWYNATDLIHVSQIPINLSQTINSRAQ